jgi:transposase InsO family protein
MYMAYTNNPRMPHVRREAVRLVQAGWSTTKVAAHLGYSQSAIVKWCAKAEPYRHTIPTLSSRPHHHPRELSRDVVDAIVAYRQKYRRGAEVLQELLRRDGIAVSLSSVKRTLRRNALTYPSKWKKWHTYPPRPLPEKPGILVQIDTIHDGPHTDRLYVYTLIDVYSRWAYATPIIAIGAAPSVRFVTEARRIAPFDFGTIQSDHGSEFSRWFTDGMIGQGMSHRHSRVRTPNDNAHLERFNRTIQDECLSRTSRSLAAWRTAIPEYLEWYNGRRPHLALDMKSPIDML